MDLASQADRLHGLAEKNGPMTGKQLVERSGLEAFFVWKICYSDDRFWQTTIGQRYLRLDRQVEGYARLSPSILREFLGYTVVGLVKDRSRILEKAEEIHQSILKISQDKLDLARQVIGRILENQPDPELLRQNACFLIAGDVAYGMSHLEPRPEHSTGKLVNGSDLDIVAITENLPAPLIHALDDSIFNQKYLLLKNPMYNEEIDYVIKDLSRVEEQLKMDRFESMVAAKILHESLFLAGSQALFDRVKGMLAEYGVTDHLARLEQEAISNRQAKWDALIRMDRMPTHEENLQLFYTMEEIEEFF